MFKIVPAPDDYVPPDEFEIDPLCADVPQAKPSEETNLVLHVLAMPEGERAFTDAILIREATNKLLDGRTRDKVKHKLAEEGVVVQTRYEFFHGSDEEAQALVRSRAIKRRNLDSWGRAFAAHAESKFARGRPVKNPSKDGYKGPAGTQKQAALAWDTNVSYVQRLGRLERAAAAELYTAAKQQLIYPPNAEGLVKEGFTHDEQRTVIGMYLVDVGNGVIRPSRSPGARQR